MEFHSLDQLLTFLRAADEAALAGKVRFPCPLCHGEAVIESAPFGRTARCPACGISATVSK